MRAAQREKPPSGLGPAGGFGVIIKKKYNSFHIFSNFNNAKAKMFVGE